MRVVLGALAAALLLPGVAYGDVTIQAIDATPEAPENNRWSLTDVTIKVGETVSWSFAGSTLLHNVRSDSSNWTLATPFATAGPTATQTFTAAGTYAFLCELHRNTMTGVIKVTDESGAPPPPPPPPPLSEQPFTNDTPALSVLELRDTTIPKLDRVKVTRVDHGVRVRFRLSEDGEVAIKLSRGGRVVKTRTVDADKGAGTATIRGLRAGEYRVQVSAKDLAGNAANVSSRARVTVLGTKSNG